MIRLATATAALLATVSGASAAITSSEAKRLEAAATITREIKDDIPEDVWNRAHCVVVIPELKKAAFIVGGEYGKGVMSCRAGDQWSAPVFMQLAKGSWGFQAGVEQVDLVLLVMNERGVQKLLQNKTTLGADASVAAGPVGRRAVAATDAAMTAETSTAGARSRGRFWRAAKSPRRRKRATSSARSAAWRRPRHRDPRARPHRWRRAPRPCRQPTTICVRASSTSSSRSIVSLPTRRRRRSARAARPRRRGPMPRRPAPP